MHGARPGKLTEYGKRLREKQKLKFCYGLNERQFKNMFVKAKAMKGVTGHNMMTLLERRLDNVIYRLRMASSRAQARQFITHGHIQVNGHRVSSPSYLVKAPATITIRNAPASQTLVKKFISVNQSRALPEWLSVEESGMSGEVRQLPTYQALPLLANEQLVVEFYSR